MSPRVRFTVRGGALGFALGLLLALVCGSRPDTALVRASAAASLLAVSALVAAPLLGDARIADDAGGNR